MPRLTPSNQDSNASILSHRLRSIGTSLPKHGSLTFKSQYVNGKRYRPGILAKPLCRVGVRPKHILSVLACPSAQRRDPLLMQQWRRLSDTKKSDPGTVSKLSNISSIAVHGQTSSWLRLRPA